MLSKQKQLFFGKKINSVTFIGLKRTKKKFLSKFIQTKKESLFIKNKIESDIQRLKNLKIFQSVSYSVKNVDKKTINLIIHFKEKFTVLPILRGGFIDGIFWVQPGFVDYHFLGNTSILSAFYRYYQRHSAGAYYQNRFLFNDHWGLSGETSYLGTIEPTDTFEFGSVSLYNVDIIKINTSINYNLSLKQFFQFTIGYLNEVYQKLDPSHIGPSRVEQNKVLFKIEHFLHNINYNGNLYKGFSNSIILEGIYTLSNQLDFFKLYNEYKYFFKFFKYDTFASRLKFGISSNMTSPYPAFVIDSFLNVRGSGNRVKRGYLENIVNLEYRYLFVITPWLSMQLVGFSDNALLVGLENKVYFFTYIGGGARIILTKIYNGILAFDYALNLQNISQHGFFIKIGQYF